MTDGDETRVGIGNDVVVEFGGVAQELRVSTVADLTDVVADGNVSRDGGIDLVGPDECCRQSVGDVDQFAERINQLADSPALRKDMGEYNRAKVEKYFTLERMVTEYQELFELVLEDSHRS